MANFKEWQRGQHNVKNNVLKTDRPCEKKLEEAENSVKVGTSWESWLVFSSQLLQSISPTLEKAQFVELMDNFLFIEVKHLTTLVLE